MCCLGHFIILTNSCYPPAITKDYLDDGDVAVTEVSTNCNIILNLCPEIQSVIVQRVQSMDFSHNFEV